MQGDFRNLFQEMKQDPDLIFRYTRMDVNMFDVLLTILFPYLSLKSTKVLPSDITLGESTAHAVVKRTCAAIVVALSPLYLRTPNKNEWEEICAGYKIGIFLFVHHQILAFYIIIIKKTFSIVLLAACNYKYKFTLIDVGSYGSESDGKVFAESNLSTSRDNTLNLPKGTAKLPGSELQISYFFVADDAFACRKYDEIIFKKTSQ
ncbi:hypothetical protein ACFW04_014234 [Cataglyphis niger]